MREHVHDYSDEEEISAYLKKLLHKEAFDKRGLIYGMGHAIYSVSDPRAEVFNVLGCQCECGFLQRICLQHAGSAAGALHTDVCYCTYRRLERTSYGRAYQCG